MVERVTGRGLPELLDERLFQPMGIEHAEWDRVASGAAFGFHGLHLTTEAVAAFGELLLRGGVWGDRQLVPREWVRARDQAAHRDACRSRTARGDADFLCGYGYQFWMSRHGYHGTAPSASTAWSYPSHDLVVAVTAGDGPAQACSTRSGTACCPAWTTRGSAHGRRDPRRSAAAAVVRAGAGFGRPRPSGQGEIDASAEDSALPDGTTVTVEPVDGGWHLRLGVVPRRRGRPRRLAGKLTAWPPGRRHRRLAGQHVRRRPLRHHHPAPGSAGGRRRRGDGGRRRGAPCL